MNISVDEAASRLGISIATVRRKLQSGDLAGQKVGGRWIVHGNKLPSRSSAPSTGVSATTPSIDLERALAQLRRTDLKELWIPDILNWEDFAKNPSELLFRAGLKCGGAPADLVESVEVPKGEYLSRSGSIMSLEDRLAYHALGSVLAPIIDSRMSDRVYSSRIEPDPKKGKLFLPGIAQWRKFQEDVHQERLVSGPWVAETDLVSYFETISHRLLFQELESLGAPPQVVQVLRRLMDQWRVGVHHGIPTGPDISRLLGNFFMVRIDEYMLNEGIRYFRFMDDVRIVGSSKDEVIAGLRMFEVACRARGQIVSPSKTRITDELPWSLNDPEVEFAAYFFRSGSGEARKVLRQLLTSALKEDRIKVKHAKFALLRLATLVDAEIRGKVLKGLRSLKEASPESATYLRAFISRRDVQTALSAYLAKTPEPILEVYQQAWLIAAMLEVLGDPPHEWVDYAARIALDRNRPAFLRILAANLMALGRRSEHVSWIREEARKNFDPTLVRGYAAALARVSELDKQTRMAIEARHSQLQCTLEYLGARGSLPSLVQEGLWSSIRNVPNS